MLLMEIYDSPHEQVIVNTLVSNILKFVDPSEREMASQWANAEKVLEDIETGQVFDDILIEFQTLMKNNLQMMGYNSQKALKGQ